MIISLQKFRNLLASVIDDIDAGNSYMTEEELMVAMEAVGQLANKQKPMTKYQAAEYIHVSRATFDNLVRDGKLPNGKKLYQGDSNLFWYRKDLDNFLKSKKHGNY